VLLGLRDLVNFLPVKYPEDPLGSSYLGSDENFCNTHDRAPLNLKAIRDTFDGEFSRMLFERKAELN
jgi:hypothetical protein